MNDTLSDTSELTIRSENKLAFQGSTGPSKCLNAHARGAKAACPKRGQRSIPEGVIKAAWDPKTPPYYWGLLYHIPHVSNDKLKCPDKRVEFDRHIESRKLFSQATSDCRCNMWGLLNQAHLL